MVASPTHMNSDGVEPAAPPRPLLNLGMAMTLYWSRAPDKSFFILMQSCPAVLLLLPLLVVPYGVCLVKLGLGTTQVPRCVAARPEAEVLQMTPPRAKVHCRVVEAHVVAGTALGQLRLPAVSNALTKMGMGMSDVHWT